jgi:hypothetical protein
MSLSQAVPAVPLAALALHGTPNVSWPTAFLIAFLACAFLSQRWYRLRLPSGKVCQLTIGRDTPPKDDR